MKMDLFCNDEVVVNIVDDCELDVKCGDVLTRVLASDRRCFAERGMSKIPPLFRFWLGLLRGGIVVQQAIVTNFLIDFT